MLHDRLGGQAPAGTRPERTERCRTSVCWCRNEQNDAERRVRVGAEGGLLAGCRRRRAPQVTASIPNAWAAPEPKQRHPRHPAVLYGKIHRRCPTKSPPVLVCPRCRLGRVPCQEPCQLGLRPRGLASTETLRPAPAARRFARDAARDVRRPRDGGLAGGLQIWDAHYARACPGHCVHMRRISLPARYGI